MNDEIKEILDNISDNIEYYYVGTNGCLYQDLTREQLLLIKDYITNLQEENERLSVELNQNMIERNNYLSRYERAIEFCDYLLAHDEVVINRKKYIKQNGDDIITKAIKSKLLGGDEEN